MKKILIVTALAVVAAAEVMAQTNAVLSRNAVGYIRRPVGGAQLDFMSAPFIRLDGAQNVISNLFPGASNNSQVIRWDKTSQAYITYLFGKGSWGTAGSNVIARGEGFYFRSPSGVSQENYVMGEVPDQFTAPTTSVAIVAGFSAASYAYPVQVAWTSTTISATLPQNSQFIVWNRTGGVYTTFIKAAPAKGGWGAATNYVLQPGEGFYVRQPGGSLPFSWSEGKPYTWP